MASTEEQFYELAALEVAHKRVVPGVMAKAYSEADGDEKKAIARYIRMRVAQLQREAVEQLAREKKQEETDHAARMRAESAEVFRANNLIRPEADATFVRVVGIIMAIMGIGFVIALIMSGRW